MLRVSTAVFTLAIRSLHARVDRDLFAASSCPSCEEVSGSSGSTENDDMTAMLQLRPKIVDPPVGSPVGAAPGADQDVGKYRGHDGTDSLCGQGAHCRRVSVFRHCIRSTPVSDSAQAVSSLRFPNWETGYEWCTSGGAVIADGFGAYLRSEFNVTDENSQFVADATMRDSMSAYAVATGASATGMANVRMRVNHSAFSVPCNVSDKDFAMSKSYERMTSEPLPGGLGLLGNLSEDAWREHLKIWRDIVGVGETDIMTLKPPSTDDFFWKNGQIHLGGSGEILSTLSQQLMFALGSGDGGDHGSGPIKFGNTTLQELGVSMDVLIPLHAWKFWQRNVANNGAMMAVDSLMLGASLLQALERSAPWVDLQDNLAFFGHDGSMDKLRGLFGITWEAPPYVGSPGVTPASGGLMFTETTAGSFRVDYVYPRFTGQVPAPIEAHAASPSQITIEELKRRARLTLKEYPDAARCAKQLGLDFA